MLTLKKDELVYKGCIVKTGARPAKPGKLVTRSRMVKQFVRIKVAGRTIAVPVKVKQQFVETVGARRATHGGQVKVLVALRLNKGTRVNQWPNSGKARAELAHVVAIVDRQGNKYKSANSPTHNTGFKYHVGKKAKPDSFDGSSSSCSNGINFFRTQGEAWSWVGA